MLFDEKTGSTVDYTPPKVNSYYHLISPPPLFLCVLHTLRVIVASLTWSRDARLDILYFY